MVKAEPKDEKDRTLYTAEQARKMLSALPGGDRLGDVFRLALVTGCRADELASLWVEDVEPDGSGFTLPKGKTSNATRYVPLIAPARDLLLRCAEKHRSRSTREHPSTGRVFLAGLHADA